MVCAEAFDSRQPILADEGPKERADASRNGPRFLAARRRARSRWTVSKHAQGELSHKRWDSEMKLHGTEGMDERLPRGTRLSSEAQSSDASEFCALDILRRFLLEVPACSRVSELRVADLALALLPLALWVRLSGTSAVAVAFTWPGKGDSDTSLSTPSSNGIIKNKIKVLPLIQWCDSPNGAPSKEASTCATSNPSVLAFDLPLFLLRGFNLGARDWENSTDNDNGTSESDVSSGMGQKSQVHVTGCIATMPAYQPIPRRADRRHLEDQARLETDHPAVSGRTCRVPGPCISPYTRGNEVVVLSCSMGFVSLCSFLPSTTVLIQDLNPPAHYLATPPFARPALLVLGYLRSYLTIRPRLRCSNRTRRSLEGL